MGSLSVQNILDRTKRQFGDTAGVIITSAAIFDWINDAAKEIVVDNDLLKVKASSITVINQSNYGFPSDLLRFHSLSYDGNPLTEISLQEARKLLNGLDDPAAFPIGVPQQFWQYGNEVFLYPSPNAARNLIIYYNRMPVAVDDVADIPELPARYDNRYVEYCLAQAAELDDDSSKAELKMGQFQDGLERARDEDLSSGLYPHMGVPLADSYGYSFIEDYG
jgi:hypothetical protein